MAFVSRNQWFLKPIFCQFHACIIGSGPSGFSVAGHLLKHNDDVKVDILEKLIAPFGLIRYGVAPDHQDIKNFTKNYEKIAMNPRVTYWGGVDVGRDVSLNTLLNIYDCVVLCYGRNVPKKLNIPGEKLSNVFNSCEIVGWYNGHPHYAHIHPNLQGSTATIIGNGNVALDIARILSSSRRLTVVVVL
uniref:NADPH:adrenodoxin oxidoreductase, mitochondrial (Trinotate prediction) n=1 Tax=Henneguya salminicola TaxID=69463 RepID=A0A6G3MES3_HENSL